MSNTSLTGGLVLPEIVPLRPRQSGSLVDTPTPMPKHGPKVPSQLGRQDTTTTASGGAIRIDVQSPVSLFTLSPSRI